MNGAELLVQTAIDAGIEICFANPGTTEMPIVEACDTMGGIRPILGLFEGVCTGAADGYGRLRGKPAMTLLHMGPGLANGLANLHNARRARSPVVNLIGEHASWHRHADPPLAMNIEALCSTVSGWQRTVESAQTLSRDMSEAVYEARQGQVSSLIVPHDLQVAECIGASVHSPKALFHSVDKEDIRDAADLLRTHERTALVLGGRGLLPTGIDAAARIKAAIGCDLLMETFPARVERGAGYPPLIRIPYFPEKAIELLGRYDALILAGAQAPVAFFGVEDVPGRLISDDRPVVDIGFEDQRVDQALDMLADALDAPQDVGEETGIPIPYKKPLVPGGKLTKENAGMTLAALQPEHAIVVDEGITAGQAYFNHATAIAPHTFMTLTGGAVGQGIPCAVGAAVAYPGRNVIDLQGDGSGMYTVQALWTQAREGLNVTNVICSNRSYRILKMELSRSGNRSLGRYTQALTDLTEPIINWVDVSKGMGVPAVAVHTVDELAAEFSHALEEPGPHLIEMVLAD